MIIDEHAESPIALGHDLRRIGDRRDLEATDVRALHLTLGDVEDESDPAAVVRGTVCERRIARAEELARAGLEIGSLQVPGHAASFEREWMRAEPRFSVVARVVVNSLTMALHCIPPGRRRLGSVDAQRLG